GGKIYNSLIVNNMANRGYGVYGEAGCIMTNATVIYNTFAPIGVPVPGTGPNIAQNATDTANYYLHQVHSESGVATATYDGDVKVQLTDFYLGATETTCLQYCVFLAGIDYTISSNIVRLVDNYRDSLWTLKVYGTGITGNETGNKTVREYYGTTIKGLSQTGGHQSDEDYCNGTNKYILCEALASGTDNHFGHLYQRNNIIAPRESTGTDGTIPDDDVSVCYVSWYGSLAYSQWLGGSLPTEAQWEFALRRKDSAPFQSPSSAGTAIADQSESLYNYAYAYAGYISGSVAPDYAWYEYSSNDASTRTAYGVNTMHNHKVGEKEPNGLGLYDMNGNVWEWCADFYPESTDYLLTDYVGNDGIEGSVVVNPINNTVVHSNSLLIRITRGGYWGGAGAYLRAGIRSSDYLSYRGHVTGFRPAFLFPFAP
ncbi:MAG: formylglycine-generating enzyme family protein, partial [Bacteroidales bacterium]|nr:formylglycine-generating enzyme family protein [Bacteroidales bacterium]